MMAHTLAWRLSSQTSWPLPINQCEADCTLYGCHNGRFISSQCRL